MISGFFLFHVDAVFLVAAAFVRADDLILALEGQCRILTLRTWRPGWAVPECLVALRIAVTAEEDFAFLRFPFRDVALLAFRADDRVAFWIKHRFFDVLDRLAIRVT